jgi:hypothetical protein
VDYEAKPQNPKKTKSPCRRNLQGLADAALGGGPINQCIAYSL